MRSADYFSPSAEAALSVQAGGGLLYQGLNSGSYLSLTDSTVTNNYVDSSFTGSTSSGLGGAPPAAHLS